jgi:hypothetical protein
MMIPIISPLKNLLIESLSGHKLHPLPFLSKGLAQQLGFDARGDGG